MNDKITVIDVFGEEDRPPRNELQEKMRPGSPQPEAGDLYFQFEVPGPESVKLPEQPGPPAELLSDYLAGPPTNAAADADAGIPGLKRKEARKPKAAASPREDEIDLDAEDTETADAGDSVRALLAEGRLDEAVALVEGLAKVNAKLDRALTNASAPVYVDGKVVRDRFRELLARAPIKDRYMIAELRSENEKLRSDLDQARADLAVVRRDAGRRR
jgi:hypothetical protein